MKSLIKKISLASLGSLLLPALVRAQSLIPEPIPGLPGDQNTFLHYELRTYLLDFLSLVGIVAVAFLIYGGFRYITSAGNDEVAESAKKTIQNAIIGLIIVILSYVIVAVIYNALYLHTV